MLLPTQDATSADTKDAAEAIGLVYVTDEKPGIRRQKRGKGYAYLDVNARKITHAATLSRISSLAIPPAYTDVWICPESNGHIQATGRDAKGRKQYRYHARFREVRESSKYAHMLEFANSLPAIRAKTQEHLAMRGLPREKVLATVVHLLETTLIRVGSDEYAKANKSYGLTTLKNRHVAVDGSTLRFNFKGKSGKQWRLALSDRRIAKVVRACLDLPGQELFQYVDDDGKPHDVTSTDVNDYLREISGQSITAKDFRTWQGTLLAVMALQEFDSFDSQAAAKKNIRDAIGRVAARLGNTPTICRKCYIHPEVFNCYAEGALLLEIKEKVEAELRDDLASLQPEEAAVLALLQARLTRNLDGAQLDHAMQAA